LDRGLVLPFFSLVERRRRIHRSTMAVFSAREQRRCNAVIPSASDIEKMALTRRPVVVYRPRSDAARAFRDLWAEVRAAAAPEGAGKPRAR
jgi:chromosome partitioning protein